MGFLVTTYRKCVVRIRLQFVRASLVYCKMIDRSLDTFELSFLLTKVNISLQNSFVFCWLVTYLWAQKVFWWFTPCFVIASHICDVPDIMPDLLYHVTYLSFTSVAIQTNVRWIHRSRYKKAHIEISGTKISIIHRGTVQRLAFNIRVYLNYLNLKGMNFVHSVYYCSHSIKCANRHGLRNYTGPNRLPMFCLSQSGYP